MRKGSKILAKKGSHAAAPIRRHGELEAEKIVVKGLKQLGLVDEAGCLSPSSKGEPRKVALASVVKAYTSIGNEWLAIRLEMGHSRSESSLIRQGEFGDADTPATATRCGAASHIRKCFVYRREIPWLVTNYIQ